MGPQPIGRSAIRSVEGPAARWVLGNRRTTCGKVGRIPNEVIADIVLVVGHGGAQGMRLIHRRGLLGNVTRIPAPSLRSALPQIAPVPAGVIWRQCLDVCAPLVRVPRRSTMGYSLPPLPILDDLFLPCPTNQRRLAWRRCVGLSNCLLCCFVDHRTNGFPGNDCLEEHLPCRSSSLTSTNPKTRRSPSPAFPSKSEMQENGSCIWH